MEPKYLYVVEETEWPKKFSWQLKLFRLIFFFIPLANPDYEKKMHRVRTWLIEFIETEGEMLPWREVALDENGEVLFAGPDKKNYGFWLDANMKLGDFNGKLISREEFESYWRRSGAIAPKIP